MAYENILVETRGRVGLITLNRPKALNALNDALMDELGAALKAFDADDAIGAIVLTGSEKAFAAGADIGMMATYTYMDVYKGDYITRNWEAVRQIREPVIAAVAGFALGGGCELAMACTLRVAADTARLGQPEINLGLIPGYAGTQRLSRLVGKGKAMEIILTGAPIGAAEAERIGLVNRVVPSSELMQTVRALAAELARQAPVAMRYILDAINHGLEMPFAQGRDFEATLFGLVAATEDMREGTRAFLEKRKAEFKGR
jgi:enoyl-CoA hydratase